MMKSPSSEHHNPDLLDTQPVTLPSAPLRSALEERGAGTRPFPRASEGFAPLPEGALLGAGRYLVREVRETGERLNMYLVEDLSPTRICPACQTETEEQFCSVCGADLGGPNPRYLVRESADPAAFEVELRLLEMELQHPALLLPRAVFTESPYGPPRGYRVEPEFTPPPASSIRIPQELAAVLEWGLTLAQGLAYLHSHRVALREVDLRRAAIQGNKAMWVNLGAASILPPAERAEPYFAQDVRALAEMLLYLATGYRQLDQARLPDQAADVFAPALDEKLEVTAADFAQRVERALHALRRPPAANLVVGCRSDVGQERSVNEDSLLTLGMSQVYHSTGVPVGVFAVADGMGGHAAGDVASRVAIQVVEQRGIGEVLAAVTQGEPLPDARRWLTETTQAASQAVYEQRRITGADMGTTLVMAYVIGNLATIANVGDSRAYLLTSDGVIQISTDHSLVERLVATGQITREEAINHPRKNIIYRVVGDRPETEVDLFEQWLTAGDALLLCSDGLSGMVPDDQMWRIWRASSCPQEACDRLIEAANAAGGRDNISVVIVQMSG